MPELLLIVGIITAAVVATTLALLAASWRRGNESSATTVPPAPEEQVAHRSPLTPREAILAAVADLESRLAAGGARRQASEPAVAYLRRALTAEAWGSHEGRDLVRLYSIARFSEHDLDAAAAAAAVCCASVLIQSATPERVDT